MAVRARRVEDSLRVAAKREQARRMHCKQQRNMLTPEVLAPTMGHPVGSTARQGKAGGTRTGQQVCEQPPRRT
eukprot:15460174-Alexandrium_andersonii.AAC.1